MKRIGKVLHSLFSCSPDVRPEQQKICETVSVPKEEDRLLALRLRKTVEDGRLFLRPGLTPADVAAELKIGMDTLERIFPHFTSENFHRYLDELRIAYAAVLFMGQESHLYSLEKIAIECGFPDSAAFANACRTLTGMTPEVMREFTRGRKNLKGLFLIPPAYMTIVSCDTLDEETSPVITSINN